MSKTNQLLMMFSLKDVFSARWQRVFFPGALWLLQVDIKRLLHQAKCPKGNSSGQVSGIFSIISQPILLLIEEIPVKAIWDLKNPVNNAMNYLSTGAGFFPSTVWELCARSFYFDVVVHVFSPGLFFSAQMHV